jgi:WD40 repeat protein
MRLHRLMLVSLLLGATAGELTAQELRERAKFKGLRFPVNRAALSPDGKVLAAGGGDTRGGDLRLWHATTGKEIAALAGYTDSLMTLAFSPDGKWLASGGIGPIQVWDVSTHKEVAAFKDLREWANLVAFSADGRRLAATGNRLVKVWDVSSGKELVSFRHRVPVHGGPGLAFSPDLATLAARNYQEIDLWDMATGTERATLSEHRGEVGCLAYSADGKTLLATSTRYYDRRFTWQGDVKLWDVATGQERASFEKGFGRVIAATLSPDGKTIALLDSPEWHAEADLKLLDVATGRQRVITVPSRTSFLSLQFTADGKLYVVGDSSDGLTVWEVPSPPTKAK